MVQYILTPWRDRRELLNVRRQFYPDAVKSVAATSSTPEPGRGHKANPNPTQPQQQHKAVARVSMWMQRGGCPHLVESTALLTAAILSDVASEGAGSAGTYAARAAYAAAFSRFVTGLLDGHQDKQRKLSMYWVAKTIGLPATFVELRHQATHEQLPSLAKLRSASRKALAWIWDYYWRHLTDASDAPTNDEAPGLTTSIDVETREEQQNSPEACRAAVVRHLEGPHGERTPEEARAILVKRWGEEQVIEALDGVADAPPSNSVMLGALRLSREIVMTVAAEGSKESEEASRGVDEVRGETEETSQELGNNSQRKNWREQGEAIQFDAPSANPNSSLSSHEGDGDYGWSQYKGVWKPKPIGVV